MFFSVKSDEQNGFVTTMFLSGGTSRVRRWDLTVPSRTARHLSLWAFSKRSDVWKQQAVCLAPLHSPSTPGNTSHQNVPEAKMKILNLYVFLFVS